MKTKPNILLVDYHQNFREGLSLFIEMENIGKIIAEADNGFSFIKLIVEHDPDIVIMDLKMTKLNGLEITKIVLDRYPKLRILAVAIIKNKESAEKLIDLGVWGIIDKSSVNAELQIAIDTIIKGEKYFSPNTIGNLNMTS